MTIRYKRISQQRFSGLWRFLIDAGSQWRR
jgi:hypothetical protein